MSTIETKHFESAPEFIAALRRSDPYWLPPTDWQIRWIFRGQACSEYKLVPSAWRDSAKQHEIYKYIDAMQLEVAVLQFMAECRPHLPTLDDCKANVRRLIVQRMFESDVALAFARLVDELGLSVPGASMPRPLKLNPFSWTDQREPPHPVFALAQHHRMPTRLLDWTHNPLIAAFFAAESVVPGEAGDMVVWALDRKLPSSSLCQEFTVPRSQIGFLHSQEALFTFASGVEYGFLQTGVWPCLEDLLPPENLRRLTLPKEKAGDLLRLLWAERISKAHLMPTLDNVTEALRYAWKKAFQLDA